MLMAKAPGSWSSFMAQVLVLGCLAWGLDLDSCQKLGPRGSLGPCYWPGFVAHSFGTGPGFLLGFLPRVLTHVKGEGHRFLVKFLAQVIGLGSRFWLLTLFQWIWLA